MRKPERREGFAQWCGQRQFASLYTTARVLVNGDIYTVVAQNASGHRATTHLLLRGVQFRRNCWFALNELELSR